MSDGDDTVIRLWSGGVPPRLDGPRAAQTALVAVESAGDHHDVTGGEIPPRLFAAYASDDARLLDIVEQVITDRLLAGPGLDTSA